MIIALKVAIFRTFANVVGCKVSASMDYTFFVCYNYWLELGCIIVVLSVPFSYVGMAVFW